MVRRFDLPRLVAGLALIPCATLFAAACGGSDLVDPEDAGADAEAFDAAQDARRTPDGAPLDDGALDSALSDSAQRDTEAMDAKPSDAEGVDTGLTADAEGADGGFGDSQAPGGDSSVVDAGAGDSTLSEGDSAVSNDATTRDAVMPPGLDTGSGGDTGMSIPETGSGEDTGVRAMDAGEDAESGANDAAETDASGRLDAEAGLDAPLEASRDAEAGREAEAGDVDLLGSAKEFAVLAGSTVTIAPAPPATDIIGDVGVSPGTAIATLGPGQPVGTVYAGGPVALQAQSDLTAAYNTLAGLPCLPANVRSGVDLGGKTLAPGVYCFPNTSAGITGNLVLDAQLDPDAVWVIQVGTTLTTATGSTVSVINGGSACNVYWQIGSSATLGTGTAFAGNIVALTSITLVTGSTILEGRALARNGAVTLDGNTVSAAACQ